MVVVEHSYNKTVGSDKIKTNNYDEIIFRKVKNYQHKAIHQKYPVAFDTETIKGKMFTICDSEGNENNINVDTLRIENQLEETLKPLGEILENMYNTGKKSLNVFFNLGYDFNAIIAHLPKSEREFFAQYGYTIYNDQWYISGIPGKSIDLAHAIKIKSIKQEKGIFTIETETETKETKRDYRVYRNLNNEQFIIDNKVKWFDLWQFFKYEIGSSSLDACSFKYLGAKKTDIEFFGYNKGNLPLDNLVVAYCLQDCDLTAKLCKIIIEACNDIGLIFNTPYSCATISADYFFVNQKLVNPNLFLYSGGKFNYKSHDIFRYAFNAYKGGRTEVTKRGYYEDVYEYDVCSMYPTNMCKLYDIFSCNWMFISDNKELKSIDPDNIAYGFFNCDIELNNNYVNPLPFANKGYYIYGYGKYQDYYLSLPEIEQIERLNLGKVIIKNGWVGLKTVKDAYPFKPIIETLYKKRKEYAKTDFRNSLIKIILNSIYGRFIEVNKNIDMEIDNINLDEDDFDIMNEDIIKKTYTAGKFFCSPYACYITALSRTKLFDQIYPNKDSFIASFTDSIFSTKPLIENSTFKIGGNLGDWENDKGELLIIGSGVYRMEYSTGKNKLRTRGFHIKENLGGADTFGLNGFDLENLILEGVEQTKVMKLKESIIQDKQDDFNTFISSYKELAKNFDKKRLWNIRLNSLQDCYKSCDSQQVNINNKYILDNIHNTPILALNKTINA